MNTKEMSDEELKEALAFGIECSKELEEREPGIEHYLKEETPEIKVNGSSIDFHFSSRNDVWFSVMTKHILRMPF